MKYIKVTSTDPCYNMAFESWALKNLPQDESYFYLWRNSPAVIVGENQDAYSEVNLDYLSEHGITLARRTTGGGAVYHDLNNLNYSFIGESVSIDPIVNALCALGVPAEKTGRNDIYVEGKKVSGYARRMECGRWLVHGTLLYDVDLTTLQHALDTPEGKLSRKGVKSVRSAVANLRDYLPQTRSVEEFERLLLSTFPSLPEYRLNESQKAEIERLNREKFSSPSWIYGRRFGYSICHSAHLPCGQVEAWLDVQDGMIRSVVFGGDFLGAKSTEELSAMLRGVKYDLTSIRDALKKERVEDYFDSTSLDQLVSLIISDTLG